jgi:hypothetical protein
MRWGKRNPNLASVGRLGGRGTAAQPSPFRIRQNSQEQTCRIFNCRPNGAKMS